MKASRRDAVTFDGSGQARGAPLQPGGETGLGFSEVPSEARDPYGRETFRLSISEDFFWL
jgi:hypothetical protein